MADIKTAYVASVAPTVTNLQSLVSSQDWTVGWVGNSVSNTSNKYNDYQYSGTFTTHASNRQAGQINVYVIGSLNDTPTWPAVNSGTIGTEGALGFIDTEERDCWCKLIASIVLDNTASAIAGFPPTGIAQFFGGRVPTHHAIFVAQNAATTSSTGLASSGSAIYYTPIYDTVS